MSAGVENPEGVATLRVFKASSSTASNLFLTCQERAPGEYAPWRWRFKTIYFCSRTSRVKGEEMLTKSHSLNVTRVRRRNMTGSCVAMGWGDL